MPAHLWKTTVGGHIFSSGADFTGNPLAEAADVGTLFTVTVRPRTVFWSAPDAGQILRYALCFAAAFGTMEKKGDDGRWKKPNRDTRHTFRS